MARLLPIRIRSCVDASLTPLIEPSQVNLVGHQYLPLGLGLDCKAIGTDGIKVITYWLTLLEVFQEKHPRVSGED